MKQVADIAQLVKRLVRNKSGKGVDSKGLERTREHILAIDFVSG
jgi:hypothetical protein